jgi:hypothetical protein
MNALEDIILENQGVAMLARLSFLDWSEFRASLPRAVRRLLQGWRVSLRFARYRPERHYMRGPGPKSLAKGWQD